MQKKKNIQVLVMLVVVIVAIAGLQFSERETGNLDIDKAYFQLNEQQEITDVYLQNKIIDNHLSFTNGQWYVNDSLLLDQSMRDVFFSVLTRMEIRRPVAEAKKDSITDFLLTKGVHVRITYADELIKDYWVGGNDKLSISWAMDDNGRVPYQIHIPGYQSYIAGIFQVPSNDWRSRFVFTINFALVKAIKLTYPEQTGGFELNYNEGFFDLAGLEADSTKIADFLDEVAFLQADRFLDTKEITDQYDSLITNNQVFSRLELIKSFGDNQEVVFYTRNDTSPYILAKIHDGSICIFDYRRIQSIFKTKADFE